MNHQKNCLFCKIVKGEIPSFKLRENDNFIAILDIFPNCKGQTLVISKTHYDSDLFEIEDTNFYLEYMKATKEVVNLLKKGLKVKKVGMIMEGMGVNHVHIKLYPMHGLDEERKEMRANEKIYFQKYEGYLTTQIGEKANDEELKSIQKQITSN